MDAVEHLEARAVALTSASDGRRPVWLYVSAVLMGPVLLDLPILASHLVAPYVPVGFLRFSVMWTAEIVLILLWLEAAWQLARTARPAWAVVLVPIAFIALELLLYLAV